MTKYKTNEILYKTEVKMKIKSVEPFEGEYIEMEDGSLYKRFSSGLWKRAAGNGYVYVHNDEKLESTYTKWIKKNE